MKFVKYRPIHEVEILFKSMYPGGGVQRCTFAYESNAKEIEDYLVNTTLHENTFDVILGIRPDDIEDRKITINQDLLNKLLKGRDMNIILMIKFPWQATGHTTIVVEKGFEYGCFNFSLGEYALDETPKVLINVVAYNCERIPS